MTVLSTAAGGLLVLAALWDAFQTLWHPAGRGRISTTIMIAVWRLSRRLGGLRQPLSGPAAMALIVLAWAVMVIVGWALVYWPHLPQDFSYDIGLHPADRGGVIDALYLSIVTVTTLGYGDIVPTASWLRILGPVEALVGFGLFTAAISWVLQIYPALTRRRSLALKLDTLRRTRTVPALTAMHPASASRLLLALSDAVGQAQVDLAQYADTYYFRDADPATSLALTIDYAQELAHQARRGTDPEVRHAGAVLEASIDSLARLLDRTYLHTGSGTAEVLRAYRRTSTGPPAPPGQ